MRSSDRTGVEGGDATITVTLTPKQRDYVRELLFEDLQQWAELLAREAQEASESQGRALAAADAYSMCEPHVLRPGCQRPIFALLDMVGWEHPDSTERRRGAVAEARQRIERQS